MTGEDVRARLMEQADLPYKEFNDRITNCDTLPSIGVRVPKIRQIARETAKQDAKSYLDEMERLWSGAPAASKTSDRECSVPEMSDRKRSASETSDRELSVPGTSGRERFQEEHMCWGMVIGCAKLDREERASYLDGWVRGILSWADCDCAASGMKFLRKDQEYWYAYVVKWLADGNPFSVRFAIVALMQHFLNDAFIDRAMEVFARRWDRGDAFYIRMAQAWALSVCFVKYRDRTLALFAEGGLDPWVHNKAIQKCRESFRVTDEDKTLLKGMKKERS